jgi:hypothetical protein
MLLQGGTQLLLQGAPQLLQREARYTAAAVAAAATAYEAILLIT